MFLTNGLHAPVPKLRAQNQVLKKAVVDEQANSASLKDQLKQRDQSLRKQEQEMDSLSFRNQQLAKRVELLQEELAASEVRSKKGKFYEADEQHRKKEAELRARLEKLEGDAEEHQAVVDGLKTKYVETIERLQSDKARLELKARDVTNQALSFIQDLVAAVLNFHTYTEQRVHIYPLDSSIEPISPLNQKVGQSHPRNPEKSLFWLFCKEEHYKLLCKLRGRILVLPQFSQYLHENAAYVRPLEDSFLQLYQSITEDTVTVLVFGRMPCHRAAPQLSSPSWQLACTVFMMPLKIATFFSNNLDFFTSPGYTPKGCTVSLNPLQAESMLANKKKATAYIHAIKTARPQSVPYREALSNRRILTSSTESREGLTQQVQQSQEKIARLEQEKEHWLLEAQLGKVRLEKENQRIADLEAQLAAALGGSQNSQTAADGRLTQSHEEAETLQKATGKEMTLCTSLVGDEESREELIKTHYMARVGELTTQLQISDSKAVHFHSEDELTTTKRSYEDQLSMMSDHLCSMNETLSKQREEIDTLKLGGKVLR
ncbi:hypothetical protein GOODEAATRI_009095 [Goodea atripinnis]|uniref:Protein phosphatase 1 regulatory subunit 21 n=1 Tax=Goodea atripinnis TaxID=208336 RepID=A0ABV0N966_9TELE